MREPALQRILDEAILSRAVPFLIAGTANSTGITFQGVSGPTVTFDSVLRIYSMTKAVAGLALAILIEREAIALDGPVSDILPEFADLKVLAGFDGDEPVLRAPKTVCTVRHLASHTSGLAYEFWSDDLMRYRKIAGHPSVMTGKLAALPYPLLFDPGTRWGYGIGIDWLGRVIEAVSGERINAFCRREVFEPLGMDSTAFEMEPTLAARLSPAFVRDGDEFLAKRMAPPANPGFYGMGHALYSSAGDYLRFLRMLLRGGELDGTRVVSAETCAMLLANHTGALAIEPMRSVLASNSHDVDVFPGTRKSHSLAAIRVEEDVPGMRSAGSQGWAGVLNSHWWIDPQRDIAAVFMTQLAPFADPQLMAAYERFERAVYAA
jgi:methyl acetate hydrolase